MLVAEWEALYGAIPRLQAEDQLAAFSAAVVAQPASSESELRQKQRVIDGWRDQLRGAVDRLRDSAVRVSLPRFAELLGQVVDRLDRRP